MADKSIKIQFKADTDALRAGLGKADNEIQTFGDRLSRWGDRAKLAFAAAAAAATAFAAKLGVDAIKAASDLNETLSKTEVLFGKSSSEVVKFADKAASAFGQSKTQALQAASTFATFGSAAGLAGQDLVKFSTDFVGLASDLASFNNTSPEQAINAIGAALRGESEPLRQYGVLINDAALKQAYFQLTGEEVSGTLTAQQKILAAQKLIYEQTTAAQGDFARTSDGLANQQRILSAEFENAKAKLGEQLLPVALEFVQFINEKVIPAVRTWIDENGPKLKKMIDDVFIPTIKLVVSTLGTIVTWIADNQELLKGIGAAILAGLAVAKITTAVNGLIVLFGALATAYAGVATAAGAAGAATTGAAAAAGTAAAAGGAWAALASRLNIVAAAAASVVGGFQLVKKGINELIDAAEAWGKSYLMQMFGLGSSSSGKAPTIPASNSSVLDAYKYQLGMKPSGMTVPSGVTVPSVTLPAGTGGGGAGGASTAAEVAKLERELGKAIVKQGEQIGSALDKMQEVIADAKQVIAIANMPPELRSANLNDPNDLLPSQRVALNFYAPVVSDPESIARLVDDALTSSASRTGNYTNLGSSRTSLPAAAI